MSEIMSLKCICGWEWKSRTAHPVDYLCSQCEELREKDRNLTLASFQQEVIEAAKAWWDDRYTDDVLAEKVQALKKAEAEYVWVPRWKRKA